MCLKVWGGVLTTKGSTKGLVREVSPLPAQPDATAIYIEPVLIVIPGALTPNGDWTYELEIEISKSHNHPVIIKRVGWDESVKFRDIAIGHRDYEIVKNLRESIQHIGISNPQRDICIYAHSYATHAIYLALMDLDIYISKIFLIGSIVKSKNIRKIRQKIGEIYCDMVHQDDVSFRLEVLLGFKYQNTSENGIEPSMATNRRWIGDHTSLASLDHYKNHILPRILGLHTKDGVETILCSRDKQNFSILKARIKLFVCTLGTISVAYIILFTLIFIVYMAQLPNKARLRAKRSDR